LHDDRRIRIQSRTKSGSTSIYLTSGSGSGSGRPKNMWIRWIRIRNTAAELLDQRESKRAPTASVPDPPYPYVFGPPGSGSTSQRHVFGSGSFFHKAQMVRKTLIPTVLRLLLDFLSLKNYVNVQYLQKVISRKTLNKKLAFCWLLDGQ
jgi:hypothetical protein